LTQEQLALFKPDRQKLVLLPTGGVHGFGGESCERQKTLLNATAILKTQLLIAAQLSFYN
jgi:hypothetical protein